MRFFILSIVAVILSCKPQPKATQGTDLIKYGIPDIIHVTNNPKITKIPSSNIVSVSIEVDSTHEMFAMLLPTLTKDINRLKLQRKQEVMSHPFYSKIVEENTHSFLFEKKLEDGTTSYDFRTIKLIGESELIYQCGNKKEYTEKEAKLMMTWTDNK